MGGVLHIPGQKQIECQHPKPILIDTGEMMTPYDWAVSLSVQNVFCVNFQGYESVVNMLISHVSKLLPNFILLILVFTNYQYSCP